MNLCPLEYLRYEVIHDRSSKLQRVVTRFPNNYGAFIWSKKGSNVNYIAVIKFFNKNVSPNEPEIGPYVIEDYTGITKVPIQCINEFEIENILEKIINL